MFFKKTCDPSQMGIRAILLLLIPSLVPSARATTISQFDGWPPTKQRALISLVANKMVADADPTHVTLAQSVRDYLVSDDGLVDILAQEVKVKIAAMDAAGATTPLPVEAIKTSVENLIVDVVEDRLTVDIDFVDHKFVITKKPPTTTQSATRP